MKTLRILVFCAVSTVDQTEDGKFSLPQQESDGRAFVESQGGVLVDVLRVPGHSRAYRSLDELAAHASAAGIDAFQRLIQHLNTADFDVFWVRDANRIARTSSLFHYVVERIIEDCAARIFSQNDGWVDERNYRMWAAMQGYKTSSEMAWIKEAWQRGMDARLPRGMAISGRIPVSHVRVRDERGRDVGLALNDAAAPLFEALGHLILEGLAWQQLGGALASRGIVTATGEPYTASTLYALVHTPLVWGHNARRHTQKQPRYGSRAWVYDASVPVPDGVTISRDVVPAVWTGEHAERIKAELRRRESLTGSERGAFTYRYSKLFVCGHCGSSMSGVSRRGRWVGVRCASAHNVEGRAACPDGSTVPNPVLFKIVNSVLQAALSGASDTLFEQSQAADYSAQIDAQQALLDRLDAQIDRLIIEQSRAVESAQPRYHKAITDLTRQRDDAQQTLDALRRAARREQTRRIDRTGSIDEIRELSLERFWQQGDTQINQVLRRIWGNERIVLLDGQPHGVITVRR